MNAKVLGEEGGEFLERGKGNLSPERFPFPLCQLKLYFPGLAIFFLPADR